MYLVLCTEDGLQTCKDVHYSCLRLSSWVASKRGVIVDCPKWKPNLLLVRVELHSCYMFNKNSVHMMLQGWLMVGRSDIGWYNLTSLVLDSIGIGKIFASFQAVGNLPVFKDRLYREAIEGASSSAKCVTSMVIFHQDQIQSEFPFSLREQLLHWQYSQDARGSLNNLWLKDNWKWH